MLLLGGAIVAPAERARAQEPAPPRLSLALTCIEPQFSETFIPDIDIPVRGHNFPPGTTVFVASWGDPAEGPQREVAVDVDAYGTFETAVKAFHPLAAATFTVRAEDRAQQPPVLLAEHEFTAPCPGTVTVDPPCSDPPPVGQQLAIRVAGNGWHDRRGFAIRFVDLAGQTLDQKSVDVVNGAFETTLNPPLAIEGPVPPLAPGLYGILVVDVQTPAHVSLFSVPCLQPQVTLDPDCGQRGAPPDRYKINVTGAGFLPAPAGRPPPRTVAQPTPGGHIEILFDAEGRREEFLVTSGVNEGGGWGPVVISPLMRDQGVYTVRVRQYIAQYLLAETTVAFTVPCREARVEIEPDCGPPAFDRDVERRYELTISGFDFQPGPATVTFDALGERGLSPELASPTVQPDGTFHQPMNPLRRPAGTYEIHVGQETRVGFTQVIAEFRVPCRPKAPTISARCEPEEPQPGQPADVLIEAAGFFELAPLVVIVGATELPPATTDEEGALRHSVPESGLPPGALPVTALQRDSSLAVVAQAATQIPLPCGTPPEPMLRVVPPAVAPGGVVVIEGTFFSPGETVSLDWSAGIAGRGPLSATADDTGTFRLQFLVFHHDFLGPREVVATRPDDPQTPLTEEPAELLVVPGRGTPPAFDVGGTDAPIVLRR